MKIRSIFTLLLSTLLIVSLGACSKKKKDRFTGVDGDYDYVSGTPIGGDAAGNYPLSGRDEGASFLSGNVNRNQFAPVYFRFDSFDIDDSEASKVQQVAQNIRSSNKEMIVAGFTDERGTAEYNRALGERRAQAVRSYLIQLGVNPSLVQTVSFGKEMPADPGSGEAAWAKNRRAEFGVVE